MEINKLLTMEILYGKDVLYKILDWLNNIEKD